MSGNKYLFWKHLESKWTVQPWKFFLFFFFNDDEVKEVDQLLIIAHNRVWHEYFQKPVIKFFWAFLGYFSIL